MRNTLHGRRRSAGAVSLLAAASAVVYSALAGLGFAAPLAPPVNTEPPTITGTPRVGNTLTAQNGTWENNPTAFQYQWQRCLPAGTGCTNIRLATQRTYRLVNADAGRTMRVRVTAVNADGATNARSAPTDIVQPTTGGGGGQPPRNTARPTITGTPTVGESLTANEGTWTNNPTSFSFQWQRCDIDAVVCAPVPGATGRSYGVRSLDVGFRIRVEVTARNAAGTGTATSNPTGIVIPRTPITNRRPTMQFISVRFTGARVYARFRICDDQPQNLRILVTESRPRARPANRRFSTRAAPRPCGAYTRNWLPARRFRGPGRYTITLRAVDTSGNTSNAARRTVRR
jgi:hypothetical protein